MASAPSSVRPPADAPESLSALPSSILPGDPQRRPAHVPVGPLTVFDGDIGQATDLCLDAIAANRGLRVATANLDFVARALRDETLKRDLERSSLVVADGTPVAWMARLAGGRRTRRVTGVDLVASLCERGSGLRVAFYGGEADVALKAAAELERRFPGVTVVDVLCPPFRPITASELQGALRRLSGAEPNLVLVALGCPRQERFIAENAHRLPGATWIGVGGTFDFFAGKRQRAPRVLQSAGLEWAARLAQEPGRLWRRYLLNDLPGLFRVAPGVLRRRHRTRPGEFDELRRALTGAS